MENIEEKLAKEFESIYGLIPKGLDRKRVHKIIEDYSDCRTNSEKLKFAEGVLGFYEKVSKSTVFTNEHEKLFARLKLYNPMEDKDVKLKAWVTLLFEIINYVKEAEIAKTIRDEIVGHTVSLNKRIELLKLCISFKNFHSRALILSILGLELEPTLGTMEKLYTYGIIKADLDHFEKVMEGEIRLKKLNAFEEMGVESSLIIETKSFDLNLSPRQLSIFFRALKKDTKIAEGTLEEDFINAFNGQVLSESFRKVHWLDRMLLAEVIGGYIDEKSQWVKSKLLFSMPYNMDGLKHAYHNKSKTPDKKKQRRAYLDKYLLSIE